MLRNLTKYCLTLSLAIFLGLLFFESSQAIAGDRTVEYKVKAAYLYNFLKFVEWPADHFASDQSEIVVCLLGQTELSSILKPMSRMQAQGRDIKIIAIDNLSMADNCQLLFVGKLQDKNMSQIIADLKGENYLTVGETEDFAVQGGMIGFILQGDKVRLEINNRAAKQANLQISAKLLEVAKLIK